MSTNQNTITYNIQVSTTQATQSVNSLNTAVTNLTNQVHSLGAALNTVTSHNLNMNAGGGSTGANHTSSTIPPPVVPSNGGNSQVIPPAASIQASLSAYLAYTAELARSVATYTLIGNAVSYILQGLKSIPEIGMKMENTHAVFKAVFNTTKEVNNQLEFLNKLADKTGAGLLNLQVTYGEFASSAKFSGESADKIQQVFADMTEAGTVLHLPQEKLKSVFVALNQIYGKNQVMMEELKKQLGNQLPAAVSVFARSMNVSTAELMDRMKKGLVKPKDTISNFAALYKQIFAGEDSFQIASQGLNANLGRLETAWVRFAQKVYTGVGGSLIGVVKGLANGLSAVTDNVDKLGIAFASGGFFLAMGKLPSLLATVKSLGVGLAAITVPAWAIGVIATTTAMTALKDITIDVNGVHVTLFEVGKQGWADLTAGVKTYWEEITNGKATSSEFVSWLASLREGTDKVLGGVAMMAAQGRTPTSGWDKITGFSNFKAGYGQGLGSTLAELMGDPSSTPLSTSGVAQRAAAAKQAQQLAAAKDAIRQDLLAKTRDALFSDSNTIADADNANAIKNINSFMQQNNKLAEAAIKHIGNVVTQELAVIEAEKGRIDRAWQAHQLSITEYYSKQVSLINQQLDLEERRLKGEINSLETLQSKNGLIEEMLVKSEKAKTLEGEYSSKLVLQNQLLGKYTLGGKSNQPISIVLPDRSPATELKYKAEIAQAKGNRELYNTSSYSKLPTSAPLILYKQDIEKVLAQLGEAKAASSKIDTQINTSGDGMGELLGGSSTAKSSIKSSIREWVAKYSTEYNVPEALALAVIKQESGGNQYRNGKTLTSSAGALGLMQLMPATARGLGVNPNDPEQNVKGGIKFLGQLLNKFKGDITLAAAGYNAGAGAVTGGYTNSKGVKVAPHEWRVPPFSQTQDYVKNVSKFYNDFGGKNISLSGMTKNKSLNKLLGDEQTTDLRIMDKKSELQGLALKRAVELEKVQFAQTEAQKGFNKELEQSNIEYSKLTNPANDSLFLIEYEFQNREKVKQLNIELADAISKGNVFQEQRLRNTLEELNLTRDILYSKEQLKSLERTAGGISAKGTNRISAIQSNKNLTEFDKLWETSTAATETATQLRPILEQQFNNIMSDISLSNEDKATKIDALNAKLRELQTQGESVESFFRENLSTSISTTFTNWANGASTTSEAFKSLGLDFTKLIQKILIDSLALEASKGLTKLGGSLWDMITGMFSQGGEVKGYAGGGSVYGAGTSLSDSIPSLVPNGSFILKASTANNIGHSQLVNLSNGEFAVPPTMVAAYGVEFWDRVNRTGRLGFANGGIVGASPPSLPFPSSSTNSAPQITINVDATGSQNPTAVGDAVSIAVIQALAKAEAAKQVALYDKGMKLNTRRAGG